MMKDETYVQPTDVTLLFLFLSFLKIGATSWGGFMALISVIQKELIEKKNIIEDKVVLDGISLASILPGPIAFNVVIFIGYRLRGMKGALVSMLGILLPSFIFMLILSYIYIEYGNLPVLENFFKGVLPAVAAIIVAVALNMAKKNIKDFKQVIICIVAIGILLISKSFFITFIIILGGAFLGYILYGNSPVQSQHLEKSSKSRQNISQLIYSSIGVVGFMLLIWFLPFFLKGSAAAMASIQKDLMLTFSTISLTLFGGGYVIIPIMQETIVSGLQWLSEKEFADAIAMGQLTPGPIFISATFIGYKVGGIIGAITATLAVFIPPGIIMIIVSQFFDHIKESKYIKAAFKGLRPAVIGMIFAAAVTIGTTIPISWFAVGVFLAVLIASVRYKVSVALLIPLSGVAGLLIF